MDINISGIQQVGIGVENVKEAWKWYRQNLGMDIKIFEDASVAEIMLPYTGGKPRERYAVLALNLNGGSGFEIWQYTKRNPEAPKFDIQIGDLGIFATKIKSKDIHASYKFFKSKGLSIISEIQEDPKEHLFFFIKDPYDNIFQIISTKGNWFSNQKSLTSGVAGAIIGVSDMDKAINFYSTILGYNAAVYDVTDTFESFKILPGENNKLRRVLLKPGYPRTGSFSKLFGSSKIELIQVLDREPKKIFKDRMWGDLGFIHICFDIHGMDALREKCKENNYPFTVDSSQSFDMGEAAGHFSYIEDPDGTLIEFVETHKIPIVKKIGWYLDLTKRDPKKQLPNWLIKALRFGRVKG
ncbi:MAG: VOC family protein [Bacteroidota bacterium]|nr:VOC family protein [Bacteroidota bacterium]